MNKSQRAVLVVGAALFVLAALVVPWTHTYDYEGIKSEQPAGYRPLFLPPAPLPRYAPAACGVRINLAQLAVTLAALAAATAAAFLVARR